MEDQFKFIFQLTLRLEVVY